MAPTEQVLCQTTEGDLAKQSTEQKKKNPLAWSVQHLVEQGITEVPKQYIQTGRKGFEFPLSENDDGSDIPVIDFGKLQADDAEEVSKLLKACEDWGFFQLANHGLPEELIVQTQSVARQFFNMPAEEKVVFVDKNPDALATGYGRINYVAQDCPPDWGDSLAIDVNAESDMSSWPSKPEAFRDTFWEYSQATIKLAIKLLQTIFGHGLGLPEDFVETRLGPIGSQMACNFYPRCPQPDLVYGLSAHSDPPLITLLLQNMEGLYVLREERWRLVKPLHNHFVVNLGDQTEIVSNGKYKTPIHRAVVNSRKDRLSVVSFVRPAFEAIVGPPADILDESRPAQYMSLTYKEYMERLENAGTFGKTGLDSIRIPPPCQA